MEFIVAIDGPAGSGKSTVAKQIAKQLDFTYIDTGAMYRILTLNVLENGINVLDKEAIIKLLEKTEINMENDKFYLNNKDVSEKIRTTEVSQNVGQVAAIKEVREKLVDFQRTIGKGKKSILDGRDIGTVVFPNADLKIFLLASPVERAKRRKKDYENAGKKMDLKEVLHEIMERDRIDTERKESPLKKASDAIELDTTLKDVEDVQFEIVAYIERRIIDKVVL